MRGSNLLWGWGQIVIIHREALHPTSPVPVIPSVPISWHYTRTVGTRIKSTPMIEINVCHIEVTVVFSHTNKNKILLSHSLSQQITWLEMLVTVLWLFIAHWSQQSQLSDKKSSTWTSNKSVEWESFLARTSNKFHMILTFKHLLLFFPQWEQSFIMQIPINCNERFKSSNLKYSIVKLNPSNQCDIIPVTTVSVTKQYVGFSAFYS